MIYDCKKKRWYYQQEKFMYSNLLRVKFEYTLTDPLFLDDFLFVPRIWNEDLVSLALKFGEGYDFIVFDDNVFLSSNYVTGSKNKYTKFSNGETCKRALEKFKLVNKSSFLVVNDDGTKSMVPSIYYALRELRLLDIRMAYRNQIYSTMYCDSYVSTSNNTEFTRAKYKLDYMDFYGSWDYIVCPVSNKKSKLIEKLEKESNIGYILFGSLVNLEDLDYTKKVVVNKAGFILKTHKRKTKQTITIKSAKMSTNQLIDHLKKDFK